MIRTAIAVMMLAACMLDEEVEDGESLEEVIPAGGGCGNGKLCMYEAAYPPRGLYTASPVHPGKCYTFDGQTAPARFNDRISVVKNLSNYYVKLFSHGWCRSQYGYLVIGPNESRVLNEFNDVTSSYWFVPAGQRP